MSQTYTLPRRQYVKKAAATVFGFQIVPRHVIGGPGFTPPSEKVNLGCIGIGGQGGGDIRDLDDSGLANIVALCDVDLDHSAATIKKYPGAKLYRDYRELIDKQKDIDAVLVATPDHVHAPASIMAMRAGRHVYVEKPLAHTIAEARAMRDVAAETKRVTQMGNQGHASEGIRLTREWIQAGAIGKVSEVHVWSDRPGKFWDSQGKAYPTDTPPVPKNLDWDLWLGPAKARAYHPDFCPRKWRGWWDFGCGALGDMAVHNADPAFYALDLDAPDWVEAENGPNNNQSYPTWSIITYHFPAKGDRPAVKMVWYDGGKLPPARKVSKKHATSATTASTSWETKAASSPAVGPARHASCPKPRCSSSSSPRKRSPAASAATTKNSSRPAKPATRRMPSPASGIPPPSPNLSSSACWLCVSANVSSGIRRPSNHPTPRKRMRSSIRRIGRGMGSK